MKIRLILPFLIIPLITSCVVRAYLRDEPYVYVPGFQKPMTKSYTDAKQRAQDVEACGFNRDSKNAVISCMKKKGYVYFNHDICFRYGLDLGLCNVD